MHTGQQGFCLAQVMSIERREPTFLQPWRFLLPEPMTLPLELGGGPLKQVELDV
jgi:hypothetical protein